MKWRLLELTENDGAANMAVDEALTLSIGSGKSLPTIRFYKWKPAAVSLGYFQKADDINLEFCKKNRIGIVRRLTGGKAVYHDARDLTYSVIAPTSLFSGDLRESYQEICSWLINGLKEIGITAVLEDLNDLRVDRKKISGNAQARVNNCVLQHGTIVYKFDVDSTMQVLKLTDKEKVTNEITSVLDHKEIRFEEVYESIKSNFINRKEIVENKLTQEEIELIKKLVKEKYNTDQWNLESEGKERGACYLR